MKTVNKNNIFISEVRETGDMFCSICGRMNARIVYRQGCICNSCLEYVKSLR